MRPVPESLTAAEDRRVTLAAESDPDSPPMTDDELRQLRPASEMLPLIFGTEAAARLLGQPLPPRARTTPAKRAAD